MITDELQFSLNTSTYNSEEFNYLSGWSHYQYIEWTEDEYKIYQAKILNLINKPSSSILGKRVYLGRLSSLPRHRIKEYFKINGIEKTSKISYADSIIMNKEHIIEFNNSFDPNKNWRGFKYKRKYHIKTEEELILILKNSKLSNEEFNNALEQFKKGRKASIIVNINQSNRILSNFSFIDLWVKKLYREADSIETAEYLELLNKNPNIQVVYDEDLLKPLNKEGIKLDEEYLKILDGMFESKNQDNINLALEILSNVNIEENSLTIALFLNKHFPIFSWGSGLTIKNNISFKSVLKYFKSQNINYKKDWRTFSESLYRIHKNNPDNVMIIKDFILQNLNTYISLGTPGIKIKKLDLDFYN